MRMFRTVLAFTLVLGTVAAGSAAAPAVNERATYIVVFDDSVSDVEAEARQLVNASRGELGFVYQYALKGFSAKLTSQAALALARNPRVVAVNEDRPVQMAAEEVPTGVSRIDAPTAHASSATGAGIRVAIIDTGIDLDHPDLQANIDNESGWDCINNDAIADDDQGHGTHVAGTVAAVGGNDLGVVGVAPGATLVPVKVLDGAGNGSWASVLCGVDHSAGPGNADVANLSLGGSGSADGDCSTTEDSLHLAICNAIDAGVTVVVAAGNDATDASNFVPAAYPEVITVSAYTDLDGTTADSGCTGGRGPFRTCDETFASFSNYGSIVDVIAPGVTINSTTVGGSYGTKSGTSMASPHAAGVAALVLQANPDLTPAQVEAHLRNTGQCPDGNENGGAGDCTGQGTWTNDKDTITEPMINAAFATGSVPDEGGDINAPPTASFTFSCTDLACDFDAAGSSDSDGTIASYAWDFGDSNTASGATTSHTYGAGGDYTVTLTVTDNDGDSDTDSQMVSVSDSGSGDPDSGDDVTLTGSSENNGSTWTATVTLTGPEGTSTTGSWDVGGGETTCTIQNGQTSCTVSLTGIHKRVSSVTYTDDTLGSVAISKP